MATTRIKDIDAAIGQRLRALRLARGLNQSDLGKAVGLTFQQIQKYERGTNRIAVSTLLPLCQALGVKPDEIIPSADSAGVPIADPFSALGAAPGGIELAKIYTRIPADMRSSILSIARAMGSASAMHGALANGHG